MAITASGIGSGIDIHGLVAQLVDSERARPEQLLDDRASTLNSQISALGQLKSSISTFQKSLATLTDPAAFIIYSGSSSNESVATLSTDDSAQPGTFNINVTQIAKAHKSSSTLMANANAFEVGTGDLTIENANGDSFTLTFAGGGDNTLNAMRDAINDASDNFGVTATVINIDDGMGGSGSKLVITANETGTDNSLTFTSDPGLGMSTVTPAANAIVEIDGSSNVYNSQSNTITGAIDGISIEAKTLGTTTISVATDQDAIIESVEEFIEAYNTMRGVFNIQASYNNGSPGALYSDSTVRSLNSQITSIISDTVPSATSAFNSLSSLGITTNENGELSLNSSNLKKALDNDFDAVSVVFTATDGITARLDNTVDEYVKFQGLFDNKNESYNTRLGLIDDARARLDYRIGKLEARLTAQFIAMDGLLATLNTTGSFLTQQLANLPGVVKSSS